MSAAKTISDAIDRAGGIRAVAERLQMTTEGVRQWRVRGIVPAKRLLEVEQITGVAREQLRPDLYRKRK